MSIKLMNLVWSDNSGRLNGIETAILLKMTDYAADDGSSVYPSLSTLCKTTKFSKSPVVRAIKSLVDKGFLIVEVPGKAKHKSTIYRINVATLEGAENLVKKRKVIHKKSVYNSHCILRGYSHCILRGYSHCTLREPPSLIITTINNHHLVAGDKKLVDNMRLEEVKASIKFLKECERRGINIGNALDRYRGLVSPEYFQQALAA